MTFGHQQRWADNPYGARDLDFDTLELDVEPTDRVGAPLPNRNKSGLRRMFVGIVLVAGTWGFVASEPERAHSLADSAISLLDVAVSKARDIASRLDQQTAAVPASTSNESAALPGAIAPIEQTSVPDLAIAPTQSENTGPAADESLSTGSIGATYAATPEPAELPDKSPKRADAVAAGLSPDLPNVLLTRLSKADIKNARYAITTALAKTRDDASFAWPPAPSRLQALFEVRFVPGAAQGCRRYIVTVTKDRWSSTSAALEKCGDATPQAG